MTERAAYRVRLLCAGCAANLGVVDADAQGRVKIVFLSPHSCDPREIEKMEKYVQRHVGIPEGADIDLGRRLAEEHGW